MICQTPESARRSFHPQCTIYRIMHLQGHKDGGPTRQWKLYGYTGANNKKQALAEIKDDGHNPTDGSWTAQTVTSAWPKDPQPKNSQPQTTYKVLMLALATGNGQPTVIREVTIPNEEIQGTNTQETLAKIYYWGQNDIQELPVPSVSMGDVAVLNGEFHKCVMNGWKKLTIDELVEYANTDRTKRLLDLICAA